MTKKEMEEKIEELEKEVNFLKQNLMILPEITEVEIETIETTTNKLGTFVIIPTETKYFKPMDGRITAAINENLWELL